MGLDYSNFEEIVQTHLESQPYSICCSVCNSTLESTTTVDAEQDLAVEVEPCQQCMEEAAREAKDDSSD